MLKQETSILNEEVRTKLLASILNARFKSLFLIMTFSYTIRTDPRPHRQNSKPQDDATSDAMRRQIFFFFSTSNACRK